MPNRTNLAARMTPTGRAYLGAVIVSGLAAITTSLIDAQYNPLPFQWYLLAALTFVSGSATVNLPTAGASISVSETFVFASVLLFGPSAGTITVALDGLVISFWMAKRRPEWYRALFNMAAPAISIWVAAHLLFAIAGIEPLFNSQSSINVPPLSPGRIRNHVLRAKQLAHRVRSSIRSATVTVQSLATKFFVAVPKLLLRRFRCPPPRRILKQR